MPSREEKKLAHVPGGGSEITRFHVRLVEQKALDGASPTVTIAAIEHVPPEPATGRPTNLRLADRVVDVVADLLIEMVREDERKAA